MNIIMNVSMGWFPLKPVDKTRNAYCRCDDESLIIAMDELSIIYWSTLYMHPFIHCYECSFDLGDFDGFAEPRSGVTFRWGSAIWGSISSPRWGHGQRLGIEKDGATVQTMHGLAHRGFYLWRTCQGATCVMRYFMVFHPRWTFWSVLPCSGETDWGRVHRPIRNTVFIYHARFRHKELIRSTLMHITENSFKMF